MRTKYILILMLTAGALVALLTNSEKEVRADYEQRIVSNTEFKGAAEYRAKTIQNLETGAVDVLDRSRMMKAYQEHKKTQGAAAKNLGIDLTWLSMGPGNFGGRTRDLLIADDGVIYAGGVSGGLYRSWDLGNTWSKVPGFNMDMNVTTVEQAGNGTLLVGTGSDFDFAGASGGSGFVGTGVYKSSDNGATWSQVAVMMEDQFSTSGSFNTVDRILADKTNPDRVWVGAGGLFRYNTVTEELEDDFEGLPPFGGVQDLKGSEDGTKLYCSLNDEVYVSSDSGSNWEDVSGPAFGQVPSAGITRVGLAVSPEDPNFAYALLSDGGRMGGVYGTSNGGTTWFSLWPANDNGENPDIDPFGTNGQGNYDLCISVFPNDKERVVVGGVTLWQGGWNTQPEQIALNFGFGSNYVHSDVHHFEWDHNDKLYIVGDGGVFTSNDITVSESPTFIESNFGYVTTQFYGFGIGTDGKAIGGTQDNGTFLVNSENTTADDVFGGDGFDAEMSKVTSSAMFATSQNGPLARSFDGGNSFNSFYSGEVAALAEEGAFPFFMVCRLHENTDNEDSQQTVEFIVSDPEVTFSAGDTLNLLTNNLNQPFTHILEEPLAVRDSVVYEQTLITLIEDSLITLDLEFDSTLYVDPAFMWDTLLVIGDTEFTISLPDPSIVVSADTSSTVMVTVQVQEDVEFSEFISNTLFNVPDTLSVQDTYTTLFGVVSNSGIYVTRQALDGNAVVEWVNINDASTTDVNITNGVECMEYSQDGDIMFVGTTNGNIFRVSGFNEYWDAADVTNLTITRIFNGNGPLMGISVDPNNPNRIACALGGYGGSQKVFITDIATTAGASTNTSNFDNIWFTTGDFTGMPCYDVLIVDNDANDDDIILVATEFGVWGTDDIGNNNSWVSCSSNIDGVPVFDIKQQYRGVERFIEPTNTGEIYIATHGRGIWRTGGAVSVDELPTTLTDEVSSSLVIYPNPASESVNLEFSLVEGERLNVDIYSVTGTLMYSKNAGYVSNGTQVVTIDVSNLSTGNYIVHAHGEFTNSVGKLVVN